MYIEYILINEALKIVKKSSEINNIEDNRIIGKFQNKNVIRTKHTKELRDSGEPRDDGLGNKDIINILKKSFTTKLKTNETYNLTYKNSNDNYDMIIFIVTDNDIVIKTILQQDRISPNYKFKQGDIKVISEMFKMNFICLWQY